MKICNSCGERNYVRPLIKQDWRCKSCNSVIDPKVTGNEPISDGCRLTVRKLQHDEYPWEHENA